MWLWKKGVVAGTRQKLVCHLELELVDNHARHLREPPSHLDALEYFVGGEHMLTHHSQLIFHSVK